MSTVLLTLRIQRIIQSRTHNNFRHKKDSHKNLSQNTQKTFSQRTLSLLPSGLHHFFLPPTHDFMTVNHGLLPIRLKLTRLKPVFHWVTHYSYNIATNSCAFATNSCAFATNSCGFVTNSYDFFINCYCHSWTTKLRLDSCDASPCISLVTHCHWSHLRNHNPRQNTSRVYRLPLYFWVSYLILLPRLSRLASHQISLTCSLI